MENFIVIYPHIAKQIFGQLNSKSLATCKEASKSWKNFINAENFAWIQIVGLPRILNNGDNYLHLAAKTGQTGVHISQKG